MSKGWDNATLKKLKALTGKGLSTAEIGKRLGLSKNAVVGKLNRLGWNSKATGATADAPKTAAANKKAKTTATKNAAATPVAKASKKTTATASVKKTSAKAAPTKDAKPAKETVANATAKKTMPKAERATKDTSDKKSLNKNLAMHQRIIQHSLEMANLKPNQCRWPIGDPDSEHFHFCGETVFVGKPYCYEHCKQAYQFTPPKKK
ncbi:MAG: GcrA family cell cycle regulator [Candidatus Enterousia sp.]